MLDVLRRNSQSFLIYFIFGAIIVVFAINFGPGSSSCSGGGGGTYAAVVDGDIITQQELAVNYSRQLDVFKRNAMRGNSGMKFDEEMAEKLGLRRQVVDDLIDRKLLSQEAEHWGIRVSDEELIARLESQYGVKDVTFAQYERWVQRSFETTVPRFERRVREDIAAQKLMDLVGETLWVSNDELRSEYEREHDRVMVSVVKIDIAREDAPTPTPAAIAQAIEKDTATLQARYERDKVKYRTEKKVAVRQIVRLLPKDATEAQVAKERGVLLGIKEQIEGGADFAALAQKSSQDGATAAAGGALGTLTLGELPASLRDAVLALQPGEIAREPVRTPEGLALLQVTEVQPPAPKPFDEVKRDVAIDVLTEQTRTAKAKAQAQALLDKLLAGEKLDKLTRTESDSDAKVASKPVRLETPWVLRDQKGIPRVGASDALQKAIFELTVEKPVVPETMEVGGAFVVTVLKERERPDMAQFEQQQDTLRQQAVDTKRARVMRDWVSSLRRKARIELNAALFAAREDA
mgnify:CR=1 FL=1